MPSPHSPDSCDLALLDSFATECNAKDEGALMLFLSVYTEKHHFSEMHRLPWSMKKTPCERRPFRFGV